MASVVQYFINAAETTDQSAAVIRSFSDVGHAITEGFSSEGCHVRALDSSPPTIAAQPFDHFLQTRIPECVLTLSRQN